MFFLSGCVIKVDYSRTWQHSSFVVVMTVVETKKNFLSCTESTLEVFIFNNLYLGLTFCPGDDISNLGLRKDIEKTKN